jgi:hypothetical protein
MTEEEAEAASKMSEQAEQTFKEMAEYALSGRSPHVVLMTFGPEGKTLMGGDPAQIVLALETAKLLLVQDCIRQRELQGAAQSAFFHMPTSGNA